MAIVQINSEKNYGKAIGLLIRMGGFYWAKPDRVFQVGYAQAQALRAAGLIVETAETKRIPIDPPIEPDIVADQLFYLLPKDLKERFKKRCLKLGIKMKAALIEIMTEFCDRDQKARNIKKPKRRSG